MAGEPHIQECEIFIAINYDKFMYNLPRPDNHALLIHSVFTQSNERKWKMKQTSYKISTACTNFRAYNGKQPRDTWQRVSVIWYRYDQSLIFGLLLLS